MTCPGCNKLQYVVNGKCPECHYQFVFSEGDRKMTDFKMQNIFADLTKKRPGFYYTKNQMYEMVKDRIDHKNRTMLLIGLLVAAMIAVPLLFVKLIIVLELILVIGILSILGSFFPRLKKDEFMKLIDKWVAAGKRTGNLIEHLGLHLHTTVYEPEVYDTECVIVTDEEMYVDLLVKNKLHIKYNALVVSKKLYPSYAVPRLKELLTLDVPVYFIHNADSLGVNTLETFRHQQGINVDFRNCRDIGLFPQDFDKHRLLKRLKNDTTVPFNPLLDLLPLYAIDAMLTRYISQGVLPQSFSAPPKNTTVAKTPIAKPTQKPAPPIPASVKNTQTTQRFSKPDKKQADPQALAIAERKLTQLYEVYGNVQDRLTQMEADYEALVVIMKQRKAKEGTSANLDDLMREFANLEKSCMAYESVITGLAPQLAALDKQTLELANKTNDVKDISTKTEKVRYRYFKLLSDLRQITMLSSAKQQAPVQPSVAKTAAKSPAPARATVVTQKFWQEYQQKTKDVLKIRESFENLENQYLLHKEKTDEQAEELWQVFDQGLGTLKEDKAIKAKTRELIIAHAEKITTLANDKEACDQLEGDYKASINQMTVLTQQLQKLHDSQPMDRLMDKKNKELWLAYVSFGEEEFWTRYRELLYMVKNPMIGVASPVMPLNQQQQWEKLYDILGL